jgi:hypothetical protein
MAYVAMLKSKGQTFHAAVRALAFKWIRILYRCWKNRVPYNDELYLRQLRQKQTPRFRPVNVSEWMSRVSSSQDSGTDTEARGRARVEYAAIAVAVRPFLK